MPYFARRRLQAMIDDLAAVVENEKVKDWVANLNGKNLDQALSFEIELALTWAFSQIGDLDVEPFWWAGNRRPDIYTEHLVPDEATVVEILAMSDNRMSGEADMDHVAQQFIGFANRIRKGSGKYLYFQFGQYSGYKGGRYCREILAPNEYKISEHAENWVAHWIKYHECDSRPLQIIEEGLDVIISKKEYPRSRFHNIWSSRPTMAKDHEDNPIFERLKEKAKQLSDAPKGMNRVIILGDIGSEMLHRMKSGFDRNEGMGLYAATEIIEHFLARHIHRVDAVIVMVARRPYDPLVRSAPGWEFMRFGHPGLIGRMAGLDKILEILPSPRFEGYQVRSLARQALFSTKARAWSLGMTITGSSKEKMQVRMSARSFLDFLAGRITPDQFREEIGDRGEDGNLFEHWLRNGYVMVRIEVEHGGLDEDDDYLIIHFDQDPSAMPLSVSKGNHRN